MAMEAIIITHWTNVVKDFVEHYQQDGSKILDIGCERFMFMILNYLIHHLSE